MGNDIPSCSAKTRLFNISTEELVQDCRSRKRVQVLRLVHNHMKSYVKMERFVAQVQFQAGLEWADKMMVIIIKSGLLPYTPEWARDFRTTLE